MIEPMRRRELLAVGGAALTAGASGCTNAFEDGFEELRLTTASVSSATGAYDATLVRQFSASHPATVEVSFTNTTDERRTYPFSACPPFSGLYGSPSDGETYGLVLVPERAGEYVTFYRPRDDDGSIDPFDHPTDAIPDAPVDGCWQSRGKIDHHPIQVSRTLDPEESLANRYHVVHAIQTDECELAARTQFESNSHFLSESRWWFELHRQ